MNKDSLISALSHFIIEAKRLMDETHQAQDRQIYGLYLAHVGVILAKIAQDEGIGDAIDTMERLFSNTWLRDEKAYHQLYSAWDDFKRLLAEFIHGMTVNERLYTLGLLDEFDKAVQHGSEDRMRIVLSKCFLSENNIRRIIDHQFKKQ